MQALNDAQARALRHWWDRYAREGPEEFQSASKALYAVLRPLFDEHRAPYAISGWSVLDEHGEGVVHCATQALAVRVCRLLNDEERR